jgi:hypothetical protein
MWRATAGFRLANSAPREGPLKAIQGESLISLGMRNANAMHRIGVFQTDLRTSTAPGTELFAREPGRPGLLFRRFWTPYFLFFDRSSAPPAFARFSADHDLQWLE